MKKPTLSHLVNKNNELVGIRIETEKETFTIPLADVRRNRKQVDKIIKASNIQQGSKYIKPSYSVAGYHYN